MLEKENTKKTADFLGVGLDVLTYNDVFQMIDRWLLNKQGRSHHIACINAYCVVLAIKNKKLMQIYNGADIAGPDGMPFVLWIRKFLKSSCDRFYAPDIVFQLLDRSKKTGYTFYLYGGAQDVLNKMKRYIENRYPHTKIVGIKSPPFRALTENEDAALCNEINRLHPDITLVGLGTPKQDYWIDDHIDKLRGSVLVSCGATFDFLGGRIRMAPRFIQQSGFEWLYRLFSKDMLRLWRRYTLYNILFLWHFFLQLLNLRNIAPQRWHRPE